MRAEAVRAAAEVIAEAMYTGRTRWAAQPAQVRDMHIDRMVPVAERALAAAEAAS